MNTAIEYFRSSLRKNLNRPSCGRYLPLWDDQNWVKREIDINLDYIGQNDFLVFLYQTKRDICCLEDTNVLMLNNAIDKFLYLLFDFESYFRALLAMEIFTSRCQVVDEIIKFKQTSRQPKELFNKQKASIVFRDLVKRTDEWNYWKNVLIQSFLKIILGTTYQNALKHDLDFLYKITQNADQIFTLAMNSK